MNDTTDATETENTPGRPSKEEREAKQYVKRLRVFYMQAIGAGVLTFFLFLVNMMTSASYWWFLWPAFGFGIALGAQAIGLFGMGGLFGAEWEEREIAKRLNKK